MGNKVLVSLKGVREAEPGKVQKSLKRVWELGPQQVDDSVGIGTLESRRIAWQLDLR